MANHLTPEELSKEIGIDRQDVIRVCMQEGVPIYQGKIDKTLFQAQLAALSLTAVPAGARFVTRRSSRLFCAQQACARPSSAPASSREPPRRSA